MEGLREGLLKTPAPENYGSHKEKESDKPRRSTGKNTRVARRPESGELKVEAERSHQTMRSAEDTITQCGTTSSQYSRRGEKRKKGRKKTGRSETTVSALPKPGGMDSPLQGLKTYQRILRCLKNKQEPKARAPGRGEGSNHRRGNTRDKKFGIT